MSEIKIDGMTCGGCVNSVTRAIRRVAPDATVTVSLERGAASVEGAPDMAKVAKAIEQAGFTVPGRNAT